MFSGDDVVFSGDEVVFSRDDVVFSRDEVVFSCDDVVIDRDDVVVTGTKRSQLGSGFSVGRSLTFYDDVGFPRDVPGYLGTMKAFSGTIPAPWDVAAIMWDVPV